MSIFIFSLEQVVENGISYLISLEGQKTGFYADQRENRKLISSISEGQKTLDIFCYTGGFALNAACGGALSATGKIYMLKFCHFLLTSFK